MIEKYKKITYEYTLFAHPVFHNNKGQYYCRAANAVLKRDDACYCFSCPLLRGFTQGIQQGNPECHYFDLFPRQGLSPTEDKKRVDGLIKAGIVPEFPDYFLPREGIEDHSLAEKAFQFAAKAHEGTYRKGTKTPYIVHPMETAMIVAGMTSKPEIIAAAALHDVVEDTKYTLEDIKREFGDEVSYLVAFESEDKREHLPAADTWVIRKEEFLHHLKNAPEAAKMIALGDKLSNIRAMKRDYEVLGDKLWERFNQKDKLKHAWYYHSIVDLLQELDQYDAWIEYKELCQEVFGNE